MVQDVERARRKERWYQDPTFTPTNPNPKKDHKTIEKPTAVNGCQLLSRSEAWRAL
jgi:hypothetical protein